MTIMHKILISACLLGRPVRYDGRARHPDDPTHLLDRWRREDRLVPICPEVSGGLPVPRPPAEIVGGDGNDVLDGRAHLLTADGRDVTAPFLAGAQAALAMAQEHDVALAILKARSPSCGSHQIYDGSFSSTLRPGSGATAALLRRHDIPVFTEDQLAAAALLLEELEG